MNQFNLSVGPACAKVEARDSLLSRVRLWLWGWAWFGFVFWLMACLPAACETSGLIVGLPAGVLLVLSVAGLSLLGGILLLRFGNALDQIADLHWLSALVLRD